MKRLLSVCLCLCFIASARGENWPQFRGPNASGVSTSGPTPLRWDGEKSVNILWKTLLPGFAHSSPVVWDNRVFVTTAVSGDSKSSFIAKDRGIDLSSDNARHAWRVYCFDKTSGRVMWERTAHEGVPRARRHVKASQSNSTPATDGRFVVALFGSEGLFCYDVNGKLLWKQDLGILNPGLADDRTSEWGHASSPIIYKDRVILQCDGHAQSFIAAYRLRDGKRLWKVERGELPTWSTPVIYEERGRAVLLTNGGRFIRGYDPSTGKELWRFSDGNTEVKMPTPVIANNLAILSGGYPQGRPIYAIRPAAQGDISLGEGQESNQFVAWRQPRGSSYTGTPVVYGGYFYICTDNGVLSAYDAKTGERLYQERLGDRGAGFSASPVAADDKLYLASEDGDVYVVKAGPKYELLSINPMGEPLMATPAISGGLIILRGGRHLFAVTDRTLNANR
ncbi:MAG TPA: PQQ-binding-like beta-propeller repeat protein [Blastocatellia bacterium]